MNPDTGKIYDAAHMREMAEKFGEGSTVQDRFRDFVARSGLQAMQTDPTNEQKLVMRVDKYDLCPCGSGKQFKWCCWTGGKNQDSHNNPERNAMNDQPRPGPIPEDSIEMPKYRCRKHVWALKIAKVEESRIDRITDPSKETDDGYIITPADDKYAPFRVERAWVKKHDPKPGGYYVLYKDNYASYSPAEAFEDGYTAMQS